MKTISKVLIATVVVLLLVLPLTYNTVAAYANEQDSEDKQPTWRMRKRVNVNICCPRCSPKWHLRALFFKKAAPVTITGEVLAHHNNILVVSSEDSRLNVVLPPIWGLGSEVFNVSQLLNDGYINIGDTVTIKALQATVTNDQGVSITIIFGYEIISSEDHFYAVLPFNINIEEE